MLFIHSAFFCNDPSIPILCSKTVLLPFHPVARLSLHFLSLLADRIFFRCFVWIVWFCLGIFLVFILSPILSDSSLQVVSLVVVLLFSFCPNSYFFYVIIFACCRRFLICVSNLISHPGLVILFMFFRGNPTFSQTSFVPV